MSFYSEQLHLDIQAKNASNDTIMCLWEHALDWNSYWREAFNDELVDIMGTREVIIYKQNVIQFFYEYIT